MAYRQSIAPLSTVVVLALGGCFNPDGPALDTDGTGGSADDVGTSMTGSDPTTAAMTMTSAGTVDDTGATTDPTGDDDPTVDPPECQTDEDCAPMADECEVATCNGAGACEVADAAEGTACGDAADSQCNGADTCDGSGSCRTNVAMDGMDCSDCVSGAQCICGGGTCADCVAFADTNLFTTDRSLIGWELTGDWRLYTEAPASGPGSAMPAAVPFGNQVLGTDGNRRQPYPSGHAERSYARTPPTELPSSITFQSWHLDEGNGNFDNKIIRISTDGGSTWTDIISCPLNPLLPFCAPRNTRTADDWDSISLALPAPLIGQVGIIEFAYDTGDSCCEFEKGWFIDVTNFATECACTSDETCAPYGSDCGAGACGGNGGCNLEAVAVDTACGDATSGMCTMPDACDGDGYCRPRDNVNAAVCDDCPAGEDCNGCELGVCTDCALPADILTFDFPPFNDPGPLGGWTFNTVSGGGWGVFFDFSNNENNEGFLAPASAPMLGIDGSFDGNPDGNGETATAQITSVSDTIPAEITFRSWHQDEGGPGVDTKRIELSIDDGMTWIPLADCSGGDPLDAFPFCIQVMARGADEWDDIVLDTSMWEDMPGQLRFGYNTGDGCCGFERGWYIDDLNFAQRCLAPNLSLPNVPCQFLPEDLCITDAYCGWDTGASACFSCLELSGDEATCTANPACAWLPTFGQCGGAPPA